MRRFLFFCAFLLVVGAGPASAQFSPLANSRVTLYAEGGLGLPSISEQFDGVYSSGTSLGGGVGYLLTANMEVVVQGHYSRFPFDEEGARQYLQPPFTGVQLEDGGGAGTLASGAVNLKFNSRFSDLIGFYAAGGVGFYRYSLYGDAFSIQPIDSGSRETFTLNKQDGTSAGIDIGFGFTTPLSSSVRLRLDTQYVIILSNRPESTSVIESDGRIGYFPVQLGLSWTP
jgi:opacity protein-like surface antigen